MVRRSSATVVSGAIRRPPRGLSGPAEPDLLNRSSRNRRLAWRCRSPTLRGRRLGESVGVEDGELVHHRLPIHLGAGAQESLEPLVERRGIKGPETIGQFAAVERGHTPAIASPRPWRLARSPGTLTAISLKWVSRARRPPSSGRKASSADVDARCKVEGIGHDAIWTRDGTPTSTS